MVEKKIKIFIIGSTGSIGRQTLKIVSENKNLFEVVGICANSNVELLASQAIEFGCKYVGIAQNNKYIQLKELLKNEYSVKNILVGFQAQTIVGEIERDDLDVVVAACVGLDGLHGVLSAIKKGHNIAIANKEVLVAAGSIINNLAKKYNANLVPIDSEHSAVLQSIGNNRKDDIQKIILTASGGPFYNNIKNNIKLSDALKHPTWNMGKKITIDSATMFNKAYEIIEARWLYDTKNIEYTIHKESIIHSMVEFCDGSIIAQMSNPNMEIPISFALFNFVSSSNKKHVIQFSRLKRFSFFDFLNQKLTFLPPDENNFPAPKLAKELIKEDNILPCVFCSANDICVQLFLDGKISFWDIYKIVEKTVSDFSTKVNLTIDNVFETDKFIKKEIYSRYVE